LPGAQLVEQADLDGQEVRLRFSLLRADLYSYWID
jgi:hypothetical protein